MKSNIFTYLSLALLLAQGEFELMLDFALDLSILCLGQGEMDKASCQSIP